MWKRRIGWGVWLIAALLLYFFENNTGTRILLAAAVLLPLISVLCAAGASKSARITLTAPASCEKGAAATAAAQMAAVMGFQCFLIKGFTPAGAGWAAASKTQAKRCGCWEPQPGCGAPLAGRSAFI